MPFNPSVFKTRALTAIVFAIVMLLGLFWNGFTFIVLFSVITIGCIYEFFKIMRLIHGNKYRLYKLLAIPYIFLPFLMMVDLGTHVLSLKPSDPLDYYSPLFPCAIIFAIWINDTMAYLVGSFIGRTPFSSISPKKTWEGTIGGIILCVVSITYLGQMPVASTISPLHWAAISFLAAVFGTLGDLLESKMKRMAGLKDSGSFLPGHGGFLDRFDSLLVAVPFVWLYIRLFIHS